MTDILIATQKEISAFTYSAADLAAQTVPLSKFGSNIVESLSKNKGSLNTIIAKDPVTNEAFIAGTYRSAPELGEMPFRERVHPAAANYLERIYDQDCEQVFLIKVDACGRADDLNTWTSLWLVEGLRLNDISIEAPQTFDESAQVEMTGTFNNTRWYRILPIRFTEEADSTVLAEIVDIIYADQKSCGSCGSYSNGCEAIYALATANSGSPGLSAQLVYRVKDGGVWTSDDIDTLGGQTASALAAVGRYLLVVSEVAENQHYAIKPTKAGASVTWIAVSTGYQSGGGGRAIYAKSPSEVFIAGAGGYIYRSEDVTAGVEVAHDASLTTQDFNAIHGAGQVVVAVGDSNTILYSINNGESYSEADTAPEISANLTAVWCRSAQQWYVGTSTGKLWYTDDQGSTWTQRALPNQSLLTGVQDIKFSPDSSEVGAIAVTTSADGLVYRTLSGGRSWYTDSPAIDGISGVDPSEVNKIALCGVNQIAAGGLKTGSTDGVIAVAK